MIGQFSCTQQEDVAVAQQPPIMVMIRFTYLPQHPAVPMCFQHRSAFERRFAKKSLVGDLPVVKKCAVLSHIAV
ncbi:MAG: hypothetical protein DMG57_20970 [Acidobacteria bacterium]|nr:MAG: hypothetical protein DMG57_20970 [Acidobacteriota bacterium]